MKKTKFLFAFMFAVSCNKIPVLSQLKRVNTDSLKQVLLQTDKDFSSLSAKKGQHASFLYYMDENVTMLQPGSMPLVGKDTLRKRYNLRSDTAYTLTWSPFFADISKSGDLGYTYGVWKYLSNDSSVIEGTYCTIWKQDTAGNWKFVMDTGNEGLKKE